MVIIASRFCTFGFLEPKDVHDSEMDASDFGRVVVQERDDAVFKRRLDQHFFIYFALDPGAVGLLVPGKERFVFVVHVAADAD